MTLQTQLERLRAQLEATLPGYARSSEKDRALFERLEWLGRHSTLDPTRLPSRAAARLYLHRAAHPAGAPEHQTAEALQVAWAHRFAPAGPSMAEVLGAVFYGGHVPSEQYGLPGDPRYPASVITEAEVDALPAEFTALEAVTAEGP
jgi:hypothetical protein